MALTPVDFYKLLSDETRLRCLALLHSHKEICVCEYVDILNISQPKLSRHLAYLRRAQLVIDRREGQWVYYSLNPKLPSWIKEFLVSHMKILQKIKPYSLDVKRLNLEKVSC